MKKLLIHRRSGRTFFAALGKAGLPVPTSPGQIGELCLHLLILGIDHEMVGSACWLTRILASAPDRIDYFGEDES
jgi:hypothetical protein